MVDAKEIKAAVELMDAKDGAQWEADGSPKLDILKTLTNKPELTVDDIDEAIGPFKRGQKVKLVKQASDGPKSGVVIGASDEGEVPLPAVDLSKLDPRSPEYAMAVVTQARAEDVALKASITEAEAERNEIQDHITALKLERDKRTLLIEQYAPQVSHAQAVKEIQAQTLKGLANTRERMALATQALAASGAVAVYPSKLDAVLSTRRRTPEQTQNYAKFVHQQAQDRAAQPPA